MCVKEYLRDSQKHILGISMLKQFIPDGGKYVAMEYLWCKSIAILQAVDNVASLFNLFAFEN